MTVQCCGGEGQWRRLARRVSAAAAPVLPGAVLLVLPKCPLCLAAWLAVGTGAGISAAAAGRVREGIVVFWVLALCFSAAQLIRRRALRR